MSKPYNALSDRQLAVLCVLIDDGPCMPLLLQKRIGSLVYPTATFHSLMKRNMIIVRQNLFTITPHGESTYLSTPVDQRRRVEQFLDSFNKSFGLARDA